MREDCSSSEVIETGGCAEAGGTNPRRKKSVSCIMEDILYFDLTVERDEDNQVKDDFDRMTSVSASDEIQVLLIQHDLHVIIDL